MRKICRILISITVLWAGAAFVAPASAEFPEKAIQFIIPFGAGGGAEGSPFVTEGALVTTAANTSADADYQTAFDLTKQGNYSHATSAFSRFLAVHPDSNLRDNAEYWLAEISYAQQDFPGALTGFQKVIATYPLSRKIPDAWLKVGYCQYELNRWPEARQALNIVVTQFPETTSARFARERLNDIRKAGR